MAMVETDSLLFPILLTTDRHRPSHWRPLDRNIRYCIGEWEERERECTVLYRGVGGEGERMCRCLLKLSLKALMNTTKIT